MPTDERPADVSYPPEKIAILRQFAGMPPVNPRDRERPVPGGWRGLAGLAADVDYYGRQMWGAALASVDGETADARTLERERAALSKLAELVRQSRPYIVHDQIDHYSTGSASPYATVERDVAAYSDAIVGYLTLLVDSRAREWATSADRRGPESWESQLGGITRAIQTQVT